MGGKITLEVNGMTAIISPFSYACKIQFGLGQRKLSKLDSSDSREMPHTFTNNPQKVLTMGAAAEE